MKGGMKDVEIVDVVRNDSGQAVRVEVLADYHIYFSFIKRNGKVSQVAGGPIGPGFYAKMMKQVYGIFYSSSSSVKNKKEEGQLKMTF